MKEIGCYLFAIIPFTGFSEQLKLWYQQPAQRWTETPPGRNVRLGALVLGREKEKFLSCGAVIPNVNPGAYQYFLQVREAVFSGDYEKQVLYGKNQTVYSERIFP
jgi:alpha-L-fucosidase 2